MIIFEPGTELQHNNPALGPDEGRYEYIGSAYAVDQSEILRSVTNGHLYAITPLSLRQHYRKYEPKPVAREVWRFILNGTPRSIDAVEGDWVIYSHPGDADEMMRSARKLPDFLESFEKA